MNCNVKRGFSLVELSIVLVILGLLVGGVLSGQSLIRAAQLRGIVTEHDKWFTAINVFKLKYNAAPGDMPNATAFWGVAAAGNACKTTVGTGTQTCDGNGNGMVDWTSSSYEDLRIWQHLGNAGLIEGTFTGTGVYPTPYYVPNVNSPTSKIPNTVWAAWYNGPTGSQVASGTNNYFWEPDGNDLGYWLATGGSADSLAPEEAWNIDKKMDDGVPATGKAIGSKGDATYPCTSVAGTNATLAQDLAATYNVSNHNLVCDMDFVQQF